MVWWVEKGWVMVRAGNHSREAHSTLFTSSYVKSYSTTTFSQWWALFKSTHCPSTLTVGTITECRSSFIEAFTDKIKDETKWARAALLMGNSVAAWKEHYAITLKRRRCQEGVDAFASEFLLENGSAGDVEEAAREREVASMELPRRKVKAHIPSVLSCVSDLVSLDLDDEAGSDIELGTW